MITGKETPLILGIESSCDETSVAVIRGRKILSNVVCTQEIHARYGGVVPELASRAHMKNIVPVVSEALVKAKIKKEELHAIAYTRGPGLMGALLVGVSFAKSLSQALQIPLVEVNHMEAHILAHLIEHPDQNNPSFPFLCLTVSGGHTQLVKVISPLEFELIGETLDDAAGEAFDKAAKLLNLPYPGGPVIDKLAKEGNPKAFEFSEAKVPGLNYSFSGVKTALLYFLEDGIRKNPNFIEENLKDICASYQNHIVKYLLGKLKMAAAQEGIKRIAIAGGVSANSQLRAELSAWAKEDNLEMYIPRFEYCTDNGAMIAIAGLYKFQNNVLSSLDAPPLNRWNLNNR
ncbi:MAG: tRNA (adenosine(37)-N6)-threonylcarbamoyltransferase complex transferase subunit TsaD [Luteibaculum sp.]